MTGRFKSCFVPLCPNTSSSVPPKNFLTVPPKTGIRNLWFSTASVTNFPPLRKTVYFCEDHFQPEDLKKLKSFGSVSILEAKISPSIFPNQTDNFLVPYGTKGEGSANGEISSVKDHRLLNGRAIQCELCQFITRGLGELEEHIRDNHVKKEIEEDPTAESLGPTIFVPGGTSTLSPMERGTLQRAEVKTEVWNDFERVSNNAGLETRGRYYCSKCEFSAPNYKLLRAHRPIHFPVIKCAECEYETKRSYNMKYHMMWHRGEAPLQCYHCDYKCAKKGKLRSHMMVHTKERPYICRICGHRTAQSSNMKRHVMTHTIERPFSCDFCSYRGSTRAALSAHYLVHTGLRRYACPHCDYRSARSTDLKKHVLTHSNMKPLACPHCDYRCIQLGALKIHMSSHSRSHFMLE